MQEPIIRSYQVAAEFAALRHGWSYNSIFCEGLLAHHQRDRASVCLLCYPDPIELHAERYEVLEWYETGLQKFVVFAGVCARGHLHYAGAWHDNDVKLEEWERDLG